jgi:hypothetical protein
MRIEATDHTPSVSYDEAQHILDISGKCIPENAVEFFAPISAFVAREGGRAGQFTIRVKLDYFNTSSSKQLYDVFHQLEILKREGAKVKVIWRFERDDEDLQESGQDYETLVDVPFVFIAE